MIGNILRRSEPDLMTPFQEANGLFEPRMLWRSILRRRWIVLGVFAAVAAIGSWMTITAPRIYRATATILIERDTPNVLGGDVRDVYDMAKAYGSNNDYDETQYKMIRSRRVLQKVIAALAIAPLDVARHLADAGPESFEDNVADEPLHGMPETLQQKIRLLGVQKYSSRERMIEKLKALDGVARIERASLVVPVRGSRLVQIMVDDPDPWVAMVLANAITDAYVDVNLEEKLGPTRMAVDWLSKQMVDLSQGLLASETALYEFQKKHDLISLSIQDLKSLTTEKLTHFNEKLADVSSERIGLESRRDRIRHILAKGESPLSIQEIAANRMIVEMLMRRAELLQQESALTLKYTPEHPAMVEVRGKIALVNKEIDASVQMTLKTIENQYAIVVETERLLEQAITAAKSEAYAIGGNEIEYNRLRREADNSRSLYNLVRKRQKEADLTEGLNVNNVRKFEEARLPTLALFPKVGRNMVVTFSLAVMLAFGAALLIDHFDNTIKGRDQIEKVLNVAFLGFLPIIAEDDGKNEAGDRDLHIVNNLRSDVAECCRVIRTNLLFASTERPSRLILVTSNIPREGKSTTVVNLAVAMAQSGARTLIVDADMRRPRLHRTFGLARDDGLSSLLVGEKSLRTLVQRSPDVPGLDVLACGPIPPNPAELLHTAAFRAVLEEMRESYDRVIFDSPPVAAVADALIIASMVDGVVLVFRAGKSKLPDAWSMKQRLMQVGAPVFGAVLNEADRRDQSGGYYYYYAYSPVVPSEEGNWSEHDAMQGRKRKRSS